MEKYSNFLVNNYLMGEEIDNVDELENDPVFMKKAINMSGDYRLYNLCSDNVKKDYDFVKFYVLKFSYKFEYIKQAADYFFEHNEDEMYQTELVAILLDIPMDRESELRYRMMAHSLYYYKRIQIEGCKNKGDDFDKELGMGFLLIYDEFMESPIALDFYAKKIIDGIFEEYGINFEKMLHDNFDKPEDIDKCGINTYLLKFIGMYDACLASYVSTNIELLDGIKKDIEFVKKRWNTYVDKEEIKKYDEMFDQIHEYINGDGHDMILDETTAIYYVGKKLGVADKILMYDPIYCQSSLDEIIDEEEEKYIQEMLGYSFRERINLKNIGNIMKNVLLSKPTKEDYYEKKIVRIDFRKKNN